VRRDISDIGMDGLVVRRPVAEAQLRWLCFVSAIFYFVLFVSFVVNRFPDYVDDSAIGLKAWLAGQAGRGVACWRAADRSASREGPGSRELWCHWT